MAVKTERLSPAEHLARRIEEHKAEVARLREEFGDPTEALGALLRDRFGLDALQESYREYKENKFSHLDGDDDSALDGG